MDAVKGRNEQDSNHPIVKEHIDAQSEKILAENVDESSMQPGFRDMTSADKPPEPKVEPLHRQTLEAKVARGEKLSPEQEIDYLGTPKSEGREARAIYVRKFERVYGSGLEASFVPLHKASPTDEIYQAVPLEALEAARRERDGALGDAQMWRQCHQALEGERDQLQRELAEARELVGAAERQGLAAREKEHAADRRMLTAANEQLREIDHLIPKGLAFEAMVKERDAALERIDELIQDLRNETQWHQAALVRVAELEREDKEFRSTLDGTLVQKYRGALTENTFLRESRKAFDTHTEKQFADLITDLTAKLEIATAALERIEAMTHSWVITQETAISESRIHESYRAIARKTLAELKKK